MNFNDKVRKICKNENLNFKQFSEITGIPYASIRSYLTGRRTPHWEQINKIANTPRFEKYKDFILTIESGDINLSEGNEAETLSAEENELLAIYRKATKEQQESSIAFLSELVKRHNDPD